VSDTCETCGEHYIGDGYTTVIHCPNADVFSIEPDAEVVDCELENEE
jgi:hypothetical protein